MKYLIINADDFGLNGGVVQSICELYESGLVSSTSCMTNKPAWPQAAAYLRRHPDFAAGVHLVFNDGYPVLPARQVPALVDGNGQFISDQQIKRGFKPGTGRQLYAELKAQIERFFRDVGRLPDHLDNHCAVSYVRPDRFQTTLDLAQEYNLPIRAPFGDDLEGMAPLLAKQNNLPTWMIRVQGRWYRRKVDRAGIPRTNAFIQNFSSSGNQTPEYLLGILEDLKDGWTSELLVHPGYDGDWREKDLRALLDPRISQRLDEPDIQLVNFSNLSSQKFND